MKKQWLIFLFILILIPFAKAAITIEGPSKDNYGIGEKLDIKTTILEVEPTNGLLKIELDCGTTTPLFMKLISLEPNEQYELEEDLPIPPFTTGNCIILASIQTGEIILDQTQSNSFIISNELIGSFEIDQTEAQLGEKIKLTGTITKQDSTPLKGIVNIYFKTNENIVSMETLEVTKGSLEYTFDTTEKPGGTYIIEIDATDIYGNKYISSDLSFNLIDQLILSLELDKTDTLPNEKIKLTGTVTDIKDDKVKKGKVTISTEDQVYLTEISSGAFSQKMEIPKTIKSGQHTIHIIVEDEYGNKAEKDINFNVIPVPTALEITTSEEIIKPESTFKVTALVYDQAADLTNENTKIEIISAKKQKVLEKEVSTEEEFNVEIPQSASPGIWTITGYTAGLETKKQITVEEVSSVDISIEGQQLTVTNTGNIKYKEPIQVTFTNEETAVTKEIKPGLFGIKVTGTSVYDLGKHIKTGTYNVLAGNQEFNDISIQHKRTYFSIFYLIPVALIIVLLLFKFVAKNFKFKPKKDRHKEGQEKRKEILSKKPPMTEEQKKEQYRKEFIGHMLKQVEKRDEQIKKNLNFDFSEKKEPPKSFASVKTERKPSILSTLRQKLPEKTEQPLWRVLRKKGLDKPKQEQPKKPGLFSMFD